MKEKMLTPNEAARKLGVTRRTVSLHVPHVRHERVTREVEVVHIPESELPALASLVRRKKVTVG